MEILGMQTGFNPMAGQVIPHREANRIAGVSPVNVGSVERVVSALLGGYLLYKAATKRGFFGMLIAPLGASLVNRGVSGVCPAYGKMGVTSAKPI